MRKVGFVGVGTIAEALIIGMSADGEHRADFLLSPRNRETSARLAHRFPLASVAPDNQAVVDASDIVFIAVRPQIAEEVIKQLRFRGPQQIVSLVAGFDIKRLSHLVAPAEEIYRVIPLPANAKRRGAITLYPPSEQLAELLTGIGQLVQVDDEQQLDVVWASTSLMGAYFGFMDSIAAWLSEHGVDPVNARGYAAAVFHGLAVSALEQSSEGFGKLIADYSTPGGLNEQAYRELVAAGWTERIHEVLTLIHERILGRATLDTKLPIAYRSPPAVGRNAAD
jgi:pyrroline-5-carboxylate reductase